MTDRRLQPLWYGDALQIFAAAEHPVADAGHAIWKGNTCQAFAVFERSAADACDAVGQDDALQAFALFKSTFINALHAVRYGDARQARAPIERAFADARHAIGYYNTAAIAGIFLQHAGFNNKVVETVCLHCCLVKPFPGDGFDISADLTEAA